MTAHNAKTLAVAIAEMHKLEPFLNREKAVLWAYDQGDEVTLNMADKAYKLSGVTFQTAVTGQKEKGMEWLAERYPTKWTAEGVREAVTELVRLYSVKEDTARNWCKEHSEVLGISHPATATDSDEVIAWVVEHYREYPDYKSLKTAIISHWVAQGRSRSNVNEYTKGLRMHYAILKAHF